MDTGPREAKVAAAGDTAKRAVQAASVAAFDDAFLAGAPIFACGLVPALFLACRRERAGGEAAERTLSE